MLNWNEKVRKNRDGKIVTQTWEYEKGVLRAVIVKRHIYFPDGYVLHCSLTGHDTQKLIGNNIDEIKADAEGYLRYAARKITESLCDFL